MKKYAAFITLSLMNFITSILNGDKIINYRFNTSIGVFSDQKEKISPDFIDRFLLPYEIISNAKQISLVAVDPQKWFGLSSRTIRNLAEKQGNIGFLMGFRNDVDGDTLRIVFHFEQWPGLSNVPSDFSKEIKGVMFFPFVPKDPSVDFIPFESFGKVPYLYSKTWQKLPKYLAVALPCYVLWKQQRLVFGISPQGPFFTINLEGKIATFQRKYRRTFKDSKLSCTSKPIGITKAYQLKAFNVNVYKD